MEGITLDDLWETPDDSVLPWFDRAGAKGRTALQREWIEQGVVVLPGVLPEALIDAYVQDHGGDPVWAYDSTPYMHVPSLRALCLQEDLVNAMEGIFKEQMGLHLNLSQWQSTGRSWHQDDYLNPPYVNGHYAAVWIALADIDPRSGPFQYVPGSHKWPLIRREKMLRALGEPAQNGRDSNWPKRSEDLLFPLFEQEFSKRGLEPVSYLPKKGDVLIWHSRLAHQGSQAEIPGLERRALIAHYSALSVRRDMPNREREGVGHYFVLPTRKMGMQLAAPEPVNAEGLREPPGRNRNKYRKSGLWAPWR